MDKGLKQNLDKLLDYLKEIKAIDDDAYKTAEKILISLSEAAKPKVENKDVLTTFFLLGILLLAGARSPEISNIISVSRDIISLPERFTAVPDKGWLVVGYLIFIAVTIPEVSDALRLAADLLGLPGLIEDLFGFTKPSNGKGKKTD